VRKQINVIWNCFFLCSSITSK